MLRLCHVGSLTTLAFSAGFFFDEERTRKAALLNAVLLAACVAITFYVLTQVISADVSGLVIGDSFALMVGMLWWGLRRGTVQLVGVLFCGVALLGLTIFAYELASPGGASYSLLILAVAVAGVLLGGRAALIMAVLSVGTTFCFTLPAWWRPSRSRSGDSCGRPGSARGRPLRRGASGDWL